MLSVSFSPSHFPDSWIMDSACSYYMTPVATSSAWVVLVIQWTYKSRDRSHREYVFSVRIKYPDY